MFFTDIIINPNRLNLVSKNYNPVEARENNEILNAAYKKHQAEALSYETHLISYITNDVMERIPNDGFEPAVFSGMSSYMFDAVLKNSQSKAEKKKSELINKGQDVNLEIEETWITSDVRPGRGEEKWLNLFLRKK